MELREYLHLNFRSDVPRWLASFNPQLDYSDLEVGDGAAAQLAWLEAASPKCTPERRTQIASSLEAYFERDTWAMVVLLKRMISSSDTAPAKTK